MHTTDTLVHDADRSESVALAARIRSDAPGRGTSAPQTHLLAADEFSEVIRENAPGRH